MGLGGWEVVRKDVEEERETVPLVRRREGGAGVQFYSYADEVVEEVLPILAGSKLCF